MTSASSTVQRDGELLRIVFDFAGVVFRWQPLQLVQQHLPRHAADLDAAHATMAAVFEGFGGDWAQFDRGLVEPDELVRRIVARSGFDAAGVAALVHAVPRALQPDADTVRLLSRLRAAGARLHFLSNMPRPYAQALTARDALFALFDGGVFSSHVGLVKPEPAMFAHAARAFGAEPGELVLIDDAPRNVEAARALGWQAVLFRDAASCARELAALGVA
jgi:putative hydrolase of the HAD superfamily